MTNQEYYKCMWRTLSTAYIKGIGKTVTLGQALFSLLIKEHSIMLCSFRGEIGNSQVVTQWKQNGVKVGSFDNMADILCCWCDWQQLHRNSCFCFEIVYSMVTFDHTCVYTDSEQKRKKSDVNIIQRTPQINPKCIYFNLYI